MTEQELLEAISGHVSFGNMQPVMDAAEAYADARESKEIAELKAEIKQLREGMGAVVSNIQSDIESGLLDKEGYATAKAAQDGLMYILSPAPVTETQNEEKQ